MMSFQNEMCQMHYRTQKTHQILQKLQENEENLAIFTLILMVALGTQNVHSAMYRSFLGS